MSRMGMQYLAERNLSTQTAFQLNCTKNDPFSIRFHRFLHTMFIFDLNIINALGAVDRGIYLAPKKSWLLNISPDL